MINSVRRLSSSAPCWLGVSCWVHPTTPPSNSPKTLVKLRHAIRRPPFIATSPDFPSCRFVTSQVDDLPQNDSVTASWGYRRDGEFYPWIFQLIRPQPSQKWGGIWKIADPTFCMIFCDQKEVFLAIFYMCLLLKIVQACGELNALLKKDSGCFACFESQFHSWDLTWWNEELRE